MKVFQVLKSDFCKNFDVYCYDLNNKRLEEMPEFYNYFDVRSVTIDYKDKQVNIKILFKLSNN